MARVRHRTLGGDRRLPPLALEALGAGENGRSARHAHCITIVLEHRECTCGVTARVCQRAASGHVGPSALEPSVPFSRSVSEASGPPNRLDEHLALARDRAERAERVREEVEQLDGCRVVRGQQLQGPGDERVRCAEVGALERTPAGRSQSRRGPLSQFLNAGFIVPEFDAIVNGVRQVVADDLFEFGDPCPRLAFEPARQALVELGPQCLRNAPIGGVVDERMLEAKARSAGEKHGVVGLHQLLAQERVEVSPRRRSGGRREEVGHGAEGELPPDDRRPLGDGALARAEAVEAGGEDRVNGRRDRSDAVATVGREQRKLLGKQGVPFRAGR